MKSYQPGHPTPATTYRNTSYVAEPLEQRILRMLNNKEPITDAAEPLYTNRKDGVVPDTNIRTDKFEFAQEAMEKLATAHHAKRKAFHDELEQKNAGNKPTKIEPKAGGNDGGTPAIDATK